MCSGGVDSTVALVLLNKAIGQDRVYGLYVDTGFMRLNESKEVKEILHEAGADNLHIYDGSEEFFKGLKNVVDPEKKRRIIGQLFIDIQQKVSSQMKLNDDHWLLGQGTIYPDTIESGGTKHADKIKTHHNRAPIINELIEQGKVIEPLKELYKDEVREVGSQLGLSDEIVWRHPFPGPGLAVRTLCAKGRDEVKNSKIIEDDINTYLARQNPMLKSRILPIKSVGVQGDVRTYRHPLVLTGTILWNELDHISTQLTNRYEDINRVLYSLHPGSISTISVHKKTLTPDRIELLQKADHLFMTAIRRAGQYKEIWQAPTVLIPVSINNKKGESIVLRPIISTDVMTANFAQMDQNVLSDLTKELLKLDGITAVFYDLTNKPPGTVEWE